MQRLRGYLLALGIPGLLVISFLDSAGIPMVGGPDAVVMLLSWQHPLYFPLIALVAAIGSVLGCLVLFQIGKKSGDLALRRFSPQMRARMKDKLERNDVLAISLAVLGPPPFPTKLFILGAGVVGMKWTRFVVAVLCARFLRYLGEGYLGLRFGDQAAEMLKAHYPTIGISLLALVALVLVVRQLRQRMDSGPVESAEGVDRG